MDKRDFSNIGREFRDMFRNTINNGNYQKMNNDVGHKVSNALDIAFEEVRKAIGSIQIESQRFKSKPTSPNQNNNQQPVKQQPPKSTAAFPHFPVGQVAGTLYTVFGSIGIGVLGMAVIILTIMGIVSSGAVIITPLIIGLSIFLGACVVMEKRGSTLRNRLKRFRKYLSLLNGRSTCMIKELSSYSGHSERFITKDFRKMIAIGMFPQGHIDEKKTIIMLNRESYELYLSYQAEQKARQLEEKQKATSRKKSKSAKVNGFTNFEVHNTIEEGKAYIRQINEAKVSIPDKDVSNKIHRMEEIISKIIDYVELHTEKLPEVRRFMEYYLPTTIKLLNAYREFDRQPIQGENITTAKSEIKNALDTINHAFENLLDSLFENAAWDVSTDISVLHTMLAQEGLTEKDFNTNK